MAKQRGNHRQNQKRSSSAKHKTNTTSSSPQRNPINVHSVAEFEQLMESGRPLLIDFWAPWCGPCRMMGPIFERVGRQLEGQVHFVKVNTEELPELSAAMGIRSIPTLTAMTGKDIVDVNVGLTPEKALLRMANRLLKQSPQKSSEKEPKEPSGEGFTGKLRRWLGLGPSERQTVQQTTP